MDKQQAAELIADSIIEDIGMRDCFAPIVQDLSPAAYEGMRKSWLDRILCVLNGGTIPPRTNALYVIHPYRMASGLWAFDDVTRGLVAEPFVTSASQILDMLANSVGERDNVNVVFSDQPFQDHQHVFRLASGGDREFGGSVYANDQLGLEGWLCPALLKYFPQPPESLYVAAFPTKFDEEADLAHKEHV